GTAAAIAPRAGRDARAAEEKAGGVELVAPAEVAPQDDLGVRIDVEGGHHRRARREERVEVVALPGHAYAFGHRVVVRLEIVEAERHGAQLVVREREDAG